MSGEALTTHASLTMDLVLQLLWRHLHDGNAPMCELVNEFRATCAGDLRSFRLREFSLRVPEQRCRDPHLLHDSVGDKRNAESAPSGRSNVIVGIGRASEHQDSAAVDQSKTDPPYTQTGRRGAP